MSCRSNYCFVNRNGLILNILTFLIPETMTLRPLLRSALTLLAITSTLNGTFATTIIPFPNLGEMAKAADAVVMAKVVSFGTKTDGTITREYHQLQVMEQIKGELMPLELWELPALTVQSHNWIQSIPDDVHLIPGNTYLLFLNKTSLGWRPMLLSYGVFEQIIVGQDHYLVPLPDGYKLNILVNPNNESVEPLVVFNQAKLMDHFKDILLGKKWNRNVAMISEHPDAFWPYLDLRLAPSHCNYLLSGGIGFRWLNFPGTALNVHFPTTGDADCDPTSLANDYTANAVTALESNYTGINLGGPTSYSGFTPNCADNSVLGDDFLTWMNANLGGYRHEMIFFNDPCNQIANLSNCSGILALGGMYGFGPEQSFDGNMYYQSGAGYVIVNNAVCDCLNGANYTIVLEHEMTHSLGLDHITQGTANMNPSCCNNITSLDIDCVNYLYPPLPLPIEWQSFSAVPGPKGVQLEWTTASEWNSAWFYVERSQDGKQFQLIDRLPAAGNSTALQTYMATDPLPREGSNYYRIKQEDYDGSYSYSPVQEVTIATQAISFQQIAASAAEGILFQVGSPAHQWVTFRCYNSAGIFIYTETRELQKGVQQFTFSQPLPTDGIYVVQAIFNDQTLVLTVPSF